jgi:hypothetical protein
VDERPEDLDGGSPEGADRTATELSGAGTSARPTASADDDLTGGGQPAQFLLAATFERPGLASLGRFPGLIVPGPDFSGITRRSRRW